MRSILPVWRTPPSRPLRSLFISVAALLLLAGTLAWQLSAQGPATAPAIAPGVAPANPTRYLDNIKALTAPAMEGRGDDTKGIALAADLLEQRYKSLGLEPAGTNGYFQPFSVITGAKIAGNNQVIEQIGAKKDELKLNDDFVPSAFPPPARRARACGLRGIRRLAPTNSATTITPAST